jgi:transposase
MDAGIDLNRLSVAEKDALIVSLLARIAALERRIEELTRPPKTPDNSSIPPSKAVKSDRAARKAVRQKRGRPGTARALAEHPDRLVEAHLETCPHCESAFPAATQTPQAVYDRIELPPIRPHVTRVHLFGGRCACCGTRAMAPAPEGLQPGSPFGRSIEAMVVYLHYAQAIGLQRLRLVMGEIFGLSISEGALINLLDRARPRLETVSERIANEVRAARVVCSDETSVRVAGRTWWEWVFVTEAAALHLIRPSRGKCVPQEVFGDIRPGVWVSDAYVSQRGHAEAWQMCLAHLLRDTQYAIDCEAEAFTTQFKKLLLRAIIIARRRHAADPAERTRRRADLDHRLDRILLAAPQSYDGRKLHRRIIRQRAALFTFVTDLAVPPTNNVSERHLRPSVIFRKVTNGFRSEWGADTYAAFRSIVSTAKLRGKTVLDAIREALAQTAPQPG